MLYEYTHVTSMAGTPEPFGRQTIKKEYEKSSPRTTRAPTAVSSRGWPASASKGPHRWSRTAAPSSSRARPTTARAPRARRLSHYLDRRSQDFRVSHPPPGMSRLPPPCVMLREMSESVSSFARRGRALSFRGKGVVTSRRDSCERGTDERTHYTDEA